MNLQNVVECCPVVLVHGQSCHAKALLINSILNQTILPLFSSKWRWVSCFLLVCTQCQQNVPGQIHVRTPEINPTYTGA